MSAKSNIEWTDATWNPIVGCSIVSPGCTNCYAMKMAARIEAALASPKYICGGARQYLGSTKKLNGNAVWTGKVAQASDDILTQPLRWTRGRKIFVNSMGDLFHESIPDEWIDRVFAVMALCRRHTFQILTKRADRMKSYVNRWFMRLAESDQIFPHPAGPTKIHALFDWALMPTVLPNVWLGVSTERQQEADERIPLLLQTPAAVRFISAEPLLGPINLVNIPGPRGGLITVDWVICGGESGPGARPMHPDWARKLRRACNNWHIPFFFKQWGEWGPDSSNTGAGTDSDPIFEGKGPCAKLTESGWEFSKNGFTMPLGGNAEWMYRLGKKRAGRVFDGKEHNEFPRTKAEIKAA